MSYPGTHPIPPHTGTPRPAPPAAVPPLRAQLDRDGGPGVLPDYVVLPRVLAEQMPEPWQHQLGQLLAYLHEHTGQAPWPWYRVLPCRLVPVADCDDRQLAEVGVNLDLDQDGKPIYTDLHTGEPIAEPEQRRVLVHHPVDPLLQRPATHPGRPR